MVLSLYLSTRPLSSVYFLPVGNFTRNHFGFPVVALVLISVDIDLVLSDANIQTSL